VALNNVDWESFVLMSEAEKTKFIVRWDRLVDHEATVLSRFLNGRLLKQSAFDALLSFRMSIPSWGRFTATRLARFIQDEKWDLVPGEIKKFNTVGGVWNDRLANQHLLEVQLWETGMYPEMSEDVWSQ
jgi:hypothetical protein